VTTQKKWIQLGSNIDGDAAYDHSGFSVSLSPDGKFVSIGSPLSGSPRPCFPNHGYVRVHAYDGTQSEWIQVGDDIAGDDIAGDDVTNCGGFGYDVELYGDGQILAIGDPTHDSWAGLVRVYAYSNNTLAWIQKGDDILGNTNSSTGVSLSMSQDGKILAIGAHYSPHYGSGGIGSAVESGHARVYEYNNTSLKWIQIGDDIDGEVAGDRSGKSISLSQDGKTIVIGSPYNDGNGIDSGHARIFTYDDTNSEWVQVGNDIEGERAGGQAGYSVSLSNDAQIVAIGEYHNDEMGLKSGQVRVYEYDDTRSEWIQLGDDINAETAGDMVGKSISLANDGKIIAVGAHANDGNGDSSGHVRIFAFDEKEFAWIQVGDDIDGTKTGDFAGKSVSFSDDGQIIAIGSAHYSGEGSLIGIGHVRIYKYM